MFSYSENISDDTERLSQTISLDDIKSIKIIKKTFFSYRFVRVIKINTRYQEVMIEYNLFKDYRHMLRTIIESKANANVKIDNDIYRILQEK